MKRVILLGPLFTQAERIWNVFLKEALEKESGGAVQVTLPQEEAKRFIQGDSVNFYALVENCLRDAAIHDIAVAVLDGADADSGTCIEIGYRKGTDRSLMVIGVRTDFRSSEDRGLNAMLRICDEVVYFPAFNSDVAKLARKILGAILRTENI